ncbi:hypothetical protein ACOMHN_029857 [Nucella lapillus]
MVSVTLSRTLRYKTRRRLTSDPVIVVMTRRWSLRYVAGLYDTSLVSTTRSRSLRHVAGLYDTSPVSTTRRWSLATFVDARWRKERHLASDPRGKDSEILTSMKRVSG